MPTQDEPTPHCTTEMHHNALRTLQLHGTPALHDWLLELENECIDQLPPEDQEKF